MPSWTGGPAPRWAAFLILLGLYLTCRGYHSRDNDQAYRLPLLLHRQDPALYTDDPFVRSFDDFNPHRGYLTLIDLASRPCGLSVGLFGLFVLTFAATCAGMDRLARATWPEAGPRVGLVAVVLVLLAKAGNVGTNHLFEALLLDRLIGFALGWLALARWVGHPERSPWPAAGLLGLAALVHPSVGLQLAMLAGTSWLAWALWPSASGVRPRQALMGWLALGLAFLPWLVLFGGQAGRLLEGLPPAEMLLLSAHVQSPQHMLPHLWRGMQWLAWGCYPTLALLALVSGRSGAPPAGSARTRLAILLGVNLAGLGLAWVAVEVAHDLRATLFQPFRMATVARGLALVVLSGRVLEHWERGGTLGRLRATLLGVGLTGDGALIVATAVEVVLSAIELGWLGSILPRRTCETRHPSWRMACFTRPTGTLGVLSAGLVYLARHDPESGHLRLIGALVALMVWQFGTRRWPLTWTRRRVVWATVAAWVVPLAALVGPLVLEEDSRTGRAIVEALARRCRFGEVPADDLERLAVWCREHTPASTRFIGPPGPKTFRLWSCRSVAFNRAGSPYHAAGLADWSDRFRDHVGFEGTTAEFARAYLADRQALERRYQEMTGAKRAALARRQGATHVLAAAPVKATSPDPEGPLELLRVEGRYAVYRLR